MYLKMFLGDQLVDEKFIDDTAIYKSGFVQNEIEQMAQQDHDQINTCEDQPQFTLAKHPTKKQKQPLMVAIYSKLSLFHKFFG